MARDELPGYCKTMAVGGRRQRHRSSTGRTLSRPEQISDFAEHRRKTFCFGWLYPHDASRGPNSVLHIADESLRANLGAVDVAGRVRGDAFGRARSRYLLYRVGNEGHHGAVADVPDANAALPTIVILGSRFRF